jgi:hypothetical protein
MALFKSISRTVANIGDTKHGEAMLGMLLQHSKFLRWMEQNNGFEIAATDDKFYTYGGAARILNRAIGEEKTPQAVTPNRTPVNFSLAMQGDAVSIDASHLSDQKLKLLAIDVMLEKELKNRFKDFAKKYEMELFHGLGTDDAFKGLYNIVNGTSNIPGYSEKRFIDATAHTGLSSAPVSMDLTNSDRQSDFLEMMHKLMYMVEDVKGIFCNESFFARIQTIARKHHIIGESRDLFGVLIPTWNNIPMIVMPDSVLPNTDEDNTSETALENCTSIWLFSPGEQRFSLCTNSGLYVTDHPNDTGELMKTAWEARCAFKIEEPKSILRIGKLKL